MPTGENIKRCPFCGSRRVEIRAHASAFSTGSLTALWCECLACGGRGPTGGTRVGAVERWDHRFRGDGARERAEREA